MGRLVRSIPIVVALLIAAESAVASETASAESPEASNPSLAKEVEDYLDQTAPSVGEDTTFKAFWKEGLRFETADGAFKLHLGGRLHYDTAWITSDDYSRAQTQDQSFFRAVRLAADGTIFLNAFFKIEVDFAGADVTLKDVYMGMRKLGPAGTFTVAHFKEPMSLEALTSDSFPTFMERAAATSTFAPFRNNGLMLNNNFLEDGMLGVFAGIFKEVNDQGTGSDDGSYSFTTRICAFFLRDKDENRVLHVGFGYSYRNATNNTLQFRARPDIGAGSYFVDTGTFTANENNLVNFELMFLFRTLHLQSEFFMADCSGAGGADPTFTGWYVEVGWFVVGGRRQYGTERKVIERAEIDRNFHAGGGGTGAWQVAFRFDTIDLTDSGILGGVQDCYTIGVNWYWNPHMRIMFNVIFADVGDGGPFGEGKLTIFGTRFQFDF
jgi:phosphate-selective porin OprO/OprP